VALHIATRLIVTCFRFEGVAMLMQGRGKMQLVLVIVLSDVLFFLLENNHKYSFFTPDNKVTCNS
jgi:A-kinase anchor protein 13